MLVPLYTEHLTVLTQFCKSSNFHDYMTLQMTEISNRIHQLSKNEKMDREKLSFSNHS